MDSNFASHDGNSSGFAPEKHSGFLNPGVAMLVVESASSTVVSLAVESASSTVVSLAVSPPLESTLLLKVLSSLDQWND